ncbi:alpha/beta fold hydrolase [Halomarina salina]|uniref:Alpha/beta fold hydrolase n=1 Tax=Halomarina salina TaxID=1872699 RepID=A0ABD5RIK4_9EURY|nr:alpha/beta hydrolase [Halomarina salina]
MTTSTRGDRLDAGSATLAYDDVGGGDTVVFVHSGITDRRMWDPQVEALADRYRTVRYDLQGWGESRATGEGTHREELLALLDALDLDDVHLVGCSFGAGVALDATLERPERVRSLTLVGPTVGGHDYEEPTDSPVWDGVAERYEASVEAFEAGKFRAAAEHEVALWLVGPEREQAVVPDPVREWVTEMDEAALRREAAGRREDASDLDPPAVERLPDLAVPLLVVVGEYDLPSVHDAVERLVGEVPRVRLEVVDATAHLPSVERPAAVTALLAAFWGGLPEGTT